MDKSKMSVGDMVLMKQPAIPAMGVSQAELGIIIAIRRSNSTAISHSEHTSHIRSCYPFTYDVFFEGHGVLTNLAESQLVLVQGTNTDSIVCPQLPPR